MNDGLKGLERRGWVINDTIFIFGWTIPLKPVHKDNNYSD